jgi:hypothetical protein
MKANEDILIFGLNKVNYYPIMVKRTEKEFKESYRKNDSKSWGNNILSHFKKTNFGILGVAGSTSIPSSGMWWEDRRKMVGIVNHEHEGKKWESKYSNSLGKQIHPTIIVDGLFIVISKERIKYQFDTEVKGFHMYDVDFCFRNYLSGVDVGVMYDIRITHKSIGMTNDEWEKNRILFSEKFKENLPIKINKTKSDNLNILISCLFFKATGACSCCSSLIFVC